MLHNIVQILWWLFFFWTYIFLNKISFVILTLQLKFESVLIVYVTLDHKTLTSSLVGFKHLLF